jgi:deoxyribodipyrimidine photolyase-related protein
MAGNKKRLLVLFGNQLFPNGRIARPEPHAVFMAESEAMCRRYAAHRHKLVLVLSAMRSKADSLRESGHEVVYHTLGNARSRSFFSMLDAHLEQGDYAALEHFETESPTVEAKLQTLASKHGMSLRTRPSPMFLTSREDFAHYRASHKRLFMADFYRSQRKRMKLLMEPDGTPVGGKWSYDHENRKKLPKGLLPPPLPETEWTKHTADVVSLVDASRE